jgi:ATP-dependent DNA ligase
LQKIPPGIKPMLATLVSEPFDKPGWVYEEKYDGERILAYKEDGHVRLLSRRAIDPQGKLSSYRRGDPQFSRHNLSHGRGDGSV